MSGEKYGNSHSLGPPSFLDEAQRKIFRGGMTCVPLREHGQAL